MPERPSAIISLSSRPAYINLMVYGASGVGKTVLAGSSDKGLIIGVEDGTVAAKRQGSKADLWPLDDETGWEDLRKAYKWVKENPDHGYDWISIDGITEARDLGLNSIVRMAALNNQKQDPDIPALQHHQKIQIQLKKLVKVWNDLPVNVLYTALIDVPDDWDDEDEDLTRPAMPLIPGKKGELAQGICAMMHAVGFYGYIPPKVVKNDETQEDQHIQEKRVLVCKSSKRYFGKDRFDAIPRVENPTLPMLENMIKEAMPEENKSREERHEEAEQQAQARRKAS
jgi:hypothetical protein